MERGQNCACIGSFHDCLHLIRIFRFYLYGLGCWNSLLGDLAFHVQDKDLSKGYRCAPMDDISGGNLLRYLSLLTSFGAKIYNEQAYLLLGTWNFSVTLGSD